MNPLFAMMLPVIEIWKPLHTTNQHCLVVLHYLFDSLGGGGERGKDAHQSRLPEHKPCLLPWQVLERRLHDHIWITTFTIISLDLLDSRLLIEGDWSDGLIPRSLGSVGGHVVDWARGVIDKLERPVGSMGLL